MERLSFEKLIVAMVTDFSLSIPGAKPLPSTVFMQQQDRGEDSCNHKFY